MTKAQEGWAWDMGPVLNYLRVHDLQSKDFAAMLGTTEASVSRWLHGKRTPSAYYMLRIMMLTDINPDEVLVSIDD